MSFAGRGIANERKQEECFRARSSIDRAADHVAGMSGLGRGTVLCAAALSSAHVRTTAMLPASHVRSADVCARGLCPPDVCASDVRTQTVPTAM